MFGTYLRLGVSIYATNRQVIAAAQKKIALHARYDPTKREMRHAFYKRMLEIHKDARKLAQEFRL